MSATARADFRDLFTDDAGIAAEVGPRVEWDVAPLSTERPLVVLEWEDEDPEYHAGGVSNLRPARVTATVYADSRLGVVNALAAIKARFSSVVQGTLGTTFFDAILLESSSDVFVPREPDEVAGAFAAEVAFALYFRT